MLTLMESRSQETDGRLKLMFDDGTSSLSSATLKDGDSNAEVEADIDDSVTLGTHPHESDDFRLDPFDSRHTEQQQPRPRLTLLSQKPPSQHNSPEKQQKMAKILEQRILLSRI